MQRSGWIGLALAATLGTAQAEPVPTVKKIDANHNSYTYYNYHPKARTARPTASPAAAPSNHAEINVAAPPLQAIAPQTDPASPWQSPPHMTPTSASMPPSAAPQNVPTYTQNYNPMATSPGDDYSPIYSSGPVCAPYNYSNGGYFNNGFYNSGFQVNGVYRNGGLTVRAGFGPGNYYNQPGYYNQGNCQTQSGFYPSYGPTINNNLTPQRFDPQPGDHPFSIQPPRPR